MLFNSFVFIFLFLPIALVGYIELGARQPKFAAVWLAGSSLVFYAYWDPRYLTLLLGSALINFGMGRVLVKLSPASSRTRCSVLIAGVAFNLGLLGYYKYAGFLITNLVALTKADLAVPHIMLPLGISFFTFTQIAFLVDAYRGEASEPKPINYLLFVTYFSHLIAGPILHHKEMMPQFARAETYRFNSTNLAVGIVVFVIGLFKKVVLADGVVSFVTPVFDAAARGQHFLVQDAWAGALAYTLQLYFDFSGYCDMAIGASLMFGIALPVNFSSPYKAANIIDFWRRWHMTLSRFLRDYLYVPLGGNRKGKLRRHVNLLITMLLGGLWHGAGWTFIIWGGLHGLYLIINHAFAALHKRANIPDPLGIGRKMSWAITFAAVVFAWVFFRADSLNGALLITAGMTDASLWAPSSVYDAGPIFHYSSGMEFQAWICCALLLAIVLCVPNSQELMQEWVGELTRPKQEGMMFGRRISFQFSPTWALAIGLMFAGAFACLPQPTSFLYFNF
jgi:D-alanyl-lipoteichoic acid acyltransferase DltB (MBOAT superfamily)